MKEAKASFITIEKGRAIFIIIIEETRALFITIVIEAQASLLLLKRLERLEPHLMSLISITRFKAVQYAEFISIV
jgi:hypothetical protein